MKVQQIYARKFAKDEYGSFDKANIDGEDLLISGGNRTGKTLTFNAILYNLLGPRHTIDLSTGRQNDVRLVYDNGVSFRRGQPEAEYSNGDELTGDEAQKRLSEILCNPASEDVGSPDIIKNHFLHSHIENMPLSRLDKDQRLSHIRAVVNSQA